MALLTLDKMAAGGMHDHVGAPSPALTLARRRPGLRLATGGRRLIGWSCLPQEAASTGTAWTSTSTSRTSKRWAANTQTPSVLRMQPGVEQQQQYVRGSLNQRYEGEATSAGPHVLPFLTSL